MRSAIPVRLLAVLGSIITAPTAAALGAASGEGDTQSTVCVLINPAKDITVVSDRDEKVTDFFKRQRLVVGTLTSQTLIDQFEAKEPGPKVFVSYASYNHGPVGGGFSTFGAYVRIAPIRKPVAMVLAGAVGDGKRRVMVVFRRDFADLPGPEKAPPVWQVVGYTTRGDVRLFESGQKKVPDDFSPRDLWYVEAKKDSPEKK